MSLPVPGHVDDAALPGPRPAVEEVQGPALVPPLAEDEPVLRELDGSDLGRSSRRCRQPVRRIGGRIEQADLGVAAVVGVAGAQDEPVGGDPREPVVLQGVEVVVPGSAGGRDDVEVDPDAVVDVETEQLGASGVGIALGCGPTHQHDDHREHRCGGECRRSHGHLGAAASPSTPGCGERRRVEAERRLARHGFPQRSSQVGAHGTALSSSAATSGAATTCGRCSSPPCRAYAARSAVSPRAVWLFTVPVRQPSASATDSTLRSS